MFKSNSPAYIRAVDEKMNLEQRTEKLDTFIKEVKSSNNPDIDATDLELLEEQLHYMRGYLRVLNIRISRVTS